MEGSQDTVPSTLSARPVLQRRKWEPRDDGDRSGLCPSATAPQSGLQAKIGLGGLCPGTSPFSSPNFLSSLSPFYKKSLAPPSPSPLTSLLCSAFVKFCFHCSFSLIPSSPSPWPQQWPYPLPQTLGPAPPRPPASPLQSPQRGLSNPEVTLPSPVTAPPPTPQPLSLLWRWHCNWAGHHAAP